MNYGVKVDGFLKKDLEVENIGQSKEKAAVVDDENSIDPLGKVND